VTEPAAPIILMYHRVCVTDCDPWGLAVTPQHLDEQLTELCSERTVVPLSWLADQIRSGRMPLGVAALTFDDGYVDVLTGAKPVLEKHGCPATVFLVTGALGTAGGFWWDRLARILLTPERLPDRLELDVNGSRHVWELGPGQKTPEQLHLEVWRQLRTLGLDDREACLDALGHWSGAGEGRSEADRVLTQEEARALWSPGFIDYGAHTVDHPVMSALPEREKLRQIMESRRACEALTGRAVEGFSYPFGDFDDGAVAAAEAAGMRYACTTVSKRVPPDAQVLRLPRITVKDWDVAEFRRRALPRRGRAHARPNVPGTGADG
jgi:peptidoglycan/xylan/chitin deacetylase (PgdA/CDA1 family)